MAKAKTKRKVKSTAPPLRFNQRLVLNQYLLSLFGLSKLEELPQEIKSPDHEGLDENNISRYYHYLAGLPSNRIHISKEMLLRYDQNIVKHTLAIRGKRDRPVTWKYFQYLALLFTEIYLDRYFSDPEGLLLDLNGWVMKFNTGKNSSDQVDMYTPDDLRKLAFWNATGSGKTLLMHVNILQYRYYLELHGRTKELSRVILLTPNEGLSIQHKAEFDLSGLPAEIFNKDGAGMYKGHYIEIIDIHKLKDEEGEKTVAVESFEGNNLVLVDEGHRGSSGVDWKEKRDKLCAGGFSFEYSATFGQAMKTAGKRSLVQEYAKCIIFDYSYKYFHRDGYGKDYQILNLADDQDEEHRRRYLTACLLTFYQQLRLYLDWQREFTPYMIARPLLVFVGSKVNAVRTENKRKVSDVVDILLFLADFISREDQSITELNRFLLNRPDLPDHKGREIFSGAFTYLIKQGFTGQTLYQDMLQLLFNAEPAGLLHLERLKQSGEIGLRVGTSGEYFGVINVGDESTLAKLCEENGLHTEDRDFSDSLFQGLNEKDSRVNMLIGSKKFSEGWNSWRVSTMGLMHVGQNEGAEIIQLFGRGVRLKGLNFSLKRSSALQEVEHHPDNIEKLETLNVFGIKADYMRQFQEYLDEEGLPDGDDMVLFSLPVIQIKPERKLKYLKLKDNLDFKKNGPNPVLGPPNEYLRRRPVEVDWYPKLQALGSKGGDYAQVIEKENDGKLTARHVALLDLDAIYFELLRFKNERGWNNFTIPRNTIKELLSGNGDWYLLYIPKVELEFTGFDRVRRWQQIALDLLKGYCTRYYNYHKAAWEGTHMELVNLDEYRQREDSQGKKGNFFDAYRFRIEQGRDDLIHKLQELKKALEDGLMTDFPYDQLQSIIFSRHLYRPLIYLTGQSIKVSPVPLNRGEQNFVVQLRAYYEANSKFFNDKELYLLRNQSRGRGMGFFEANNFHPDFILWLLTGGKQYITFVDPKGLRNTKGVNDPKIDFYRTIKQIERRLGDPDVVLHSFIISQTPHWEISWWDGGMTEEDFEKRHVLFPKDGEYKYIGKIMELLLVKK